MNRFVGLSLAVVVAAAVLAACSPAQQPLIKNITASPKNLPSSGGSATLSWTATHTITDSTVTVTPTAGVSIHAGGKTYGAAADVGSATSATVTFPADTGATPDDYNLKVTVLGVKGTLPASASVLATVAAGSPTGTQLWLRQFGTGAADYGNGVAVGGSGAIVVAGTTTGKLGAASYGQYDAFLAGYGSGGSQQWVTQFGSTGNDYAHGVAIDGSGNIFVVGDTDGNLAGTSAGSSDVFLGEFSSGGKQQWLKQFGTSGIDGGESVAFDKVSGDVYVAGDLNGNAFLAKYSPNGTRLWLQQFASSYFSEAYGVAVNGSGDAVITGTTEKGQSGPNITTGDAFIAEYDGTGKQILYKQFGTSGDDGGAGVAFGTGGSIVVAGWTTGTLSGSTGSGDMFVADFLPVGTQEWATQFGGNQDTVTGIAVDGSGNALVSGSTAGNLGGTNAGGTYDAFLAKYDNQGKQTWVKQLGSSGDDEANGVAVDGSGNALLVGYTNGKLGSAAFGGYDAFLGKFAP